MKAIWKDVTNYSRDDKVREPAEWELRTKSLRICVHRYIGCGEAWFLTCHDLSIVRHDLDTTDVAAAQKKAINVIVRRVRSLAAEVAALVEVSP